MKRKTLLLAGVLLALLCAVTILVRGTSYTLALRVDPSAGGADDYRVELDQEREIVRLTQKRLDGDTLRLTFRSVSRGKAFADIFAPDGEMLKMELLFVHPFGVLTVNSYFGNAGGSRIIPIAVTLYRPLNLRIGTSYNRIP